jgi:beta-glucanase (GH16 family)
LRLQADTNGERTIVKESTEEAQLWTLTVCDQATYRLSSRNTPAPEKGRWTLVPVGDGYRLTPVGAPELALTAASAVDGTKVTALAFDGSSAQIWNILPVSESAPDPGSAYVPEGYKLVFSDEFNDPAIDTAKWETLAPFSQPHLNDEIECYQPEGVILANGMCILRAEEMATTCGGRHTWRSGAITSKSTRTYGYYEARIKVPQGQGLWPAFWLTSSKRWPPEWDIMEIPNSVGTLYQYMHPTKGTRVSWLEGIEGSDSIYSAGEGMPNPYSGFVIYGCESTPQGVKLWINGKLTAQWAVSADAEDPMWVSVNLAVGGKWPGAPDATTPRPADMYIDYVRVYQ